MKRSTLVLITAGMILGGAGVVEILGTDTAASGGAVHPAVVGDIRPARESPRSYPNATIAPGTAIQPFSEVHQLAAQQPSGSTADISAADGLLSIPAAAPRTYPG
ncbi:hypothetical protein IU510_03715 [Nocardia cyriacigeorgica]|uniref:hypothetical protein n=1 Tax=Nocardia cyriacigeorgica TaxID=135487 RepID=UPI0018959DF8|nr:hypothetical protein [Nocardia cyriacigeorgica]MBF6097184.1 hypothetical protein [Nocardia cyriacigeorgica]MBF6158659.1 hypothetical protein [Nocardia cyriacigeorgica]MBF6316519.1 hypothetical protein [Nocardia cyriacigeorgica]MBF6344945.1 hypothetical protein [Nocardia cyriacigeorgica]MBF6517287.1 hypothetical protein [Nocardia cyriacigeorgica]